MITRIELTNFKSHAHTVIEPGRVTALVGPNGCGKTGVLQAIDCISSLVNKPPSQVFTDMLSPDFLVRKHGSEFSVNAELSSDNVKIELSTESLYEGQSRGWKLRVQGTFQDSPIGVGKGDLNEQKTLSHALPSELMRQLGPSVYFKASPEKLAQPSGLEEIPPKLSSDGSGLSSVIANLILSEPARLQAIEQALCKIVPTVKKIKANHAKVLEVETIYSITENAHPRRQQRSNSKPGYEVVFDTLSADAVPAHAMSEGTLLILGMLTLLQNPNPPIIFLIEDVEQGLHPLAQRQLMQTLKDFAEKHDRQIIVTSHSPYIVDALDAKDVWVMATDKEGISHTKRLSDHPDAKRALDVLTTGELWDAEGENWVLENSPAELVNA